MATKKIRGLESWTWAENGMNIKVLSSITRERTWTGSIFNPILEVVTRLFGSFSFLSI